MELKHILARKRGRTAKQKRQSLIECVPFMVPKRAELCPARFGHSAQNRFGNFARPIAGNSEDADTPAASRRCDGGNGVASAHIRLVFLCRHARDDTVNMPLLSD